MKRMKRTTDAALREIIKKPGARTVTVVGSLAADVLILKRELRTTRRLLRIAHKQQDELLLANQALRGETRDLCRQCWKPVEASRHGYAIPTCHACLPPPTPLPWVVSRGDFLNDTSRILDMAESAPVRITDAGKVTMIVSCPKLTEGADGGTV